MAEHTKRNTTLIALAGTFLIIIGGVWLSTRQRIGQPPLPDGTTRVAVEFTGGHDTAPVDHGRPVVLIAGALGVTPEVFRQAFSRVKPARGGRPSHERVRQNKDVLMKALGPHGITNDRLDTVSNYYRYRPQNGEMWPIQSAKAYALVRDGVVMGFEITRGGSGYSSPPRVSVKAVDISGVEVKLSFGQDFKKNGAVAEMRLAPSETY